MALFHFKFRIIALSRFTGYTAATVPLHLRALQRAGNRYLKAHRQRNSKPCLLLWCLFVQTNDLEMEYIKLEVFGVEGRAPIMAKEHPVLQELFKTRAGEQLSPLLCLVLIKDSQRYRFYMQTRSLMGSWPSCPLLPSFGPRLSASRRGPKGSLTRHSRRWLASTTRSSVST